jgi:single-stranded DNA-binding protein
MNQSEVSEMARDNFVFLRGTLDQQPYFDRVPNKRRGGREPFLRFFVNVPRDTTQPQVFPHDPIRVVSYGALAERMFPVLGAGSRVHVIGWLQYRSNKKVLEVVADEIRAEVQDVAGEDILKQLQTLAEMWATSVSDALERLLVPQLKAVLGQNTHPQDSGEGAGDGD